MTAPTTQREEIQQVIAAASEPLTRPEIFSQCKLVVDEAMLSVVLSQLVRKGFLKRVGERERDKGAPLALYAAASGGGDTGAPTSAGRAKRKGKKPSKQRRPSASKKRRSAYKKRSKTTRKPKAGKSIEKVSRKTPPAPAPEDFRCGIFSDGTLEITNKEGQLTLSEPETRAMFKYLGHVLGSQAA